VFVRSEPHLLHDDWVPHRILGLRKFRSCCPGFSEISDIGRESVTYLLGFCPMRLLRTEKLPAWSRSAGTLLAVACLAISVQRAIRSSGDQALTLAQWVIAISFATALLFVWRRLKFDAWLLGIVICATALYLNYAGYTDHIERNYDGAAHLLYSEYIAVHGRLPSPLACSICGHPPLYYMLGALAIRLVTLTHVTTIEFGLQALSLAMFLAFLSFGILTIRLFASNRLAVWLGAALLAFWPTSVINSIRIHDDALASCLGAAVLYFVARWHRDDRPSTLYWATALAALAVLTKANAYSLVVLLLVVVSWRCYREHFALARIKQVAVSVLTSMLAIVLAVGSRTTPSRATGCHKALGVICDISSEHYVGNSWTNYLLFDVHFFLKQPFLINDPYDKSRDHVLNMLFKSSLFGAVPLGPEFEDRLSASLAIALNYIAFALLLVLIFGVLGVTLQQIRRHWILPLASVLLLAQLTALRIKVPLTMHADFRYIFPLLIPACVFYAKLIERWSSRSRAMHAVGASLSVLLVVVSVVFFRSTPYRHKAHIAPPEQIINCSLSAFSDIRLTGTPTGNGGNLQFGPSQVLEFQLSQGATLSQLDVSLDASDQYEIFIHGPEVARQLFVGPSRSTDGGLQRYHRSFSPTLRNVQTIRIRARQSDGHYTLGHLVINQQG
jgi:hypothetical protein